MPFLRGAFKYETLPPPLGSVAYEGRRRSGSQSPLFTGAHAARLVWARAGERTLARFPRKHFPGPESESIATSVRDLRCKANWNGASAGGTEERVPRPAEEPVSAARPREGGAGRAGADPPLGGRYRPRQLRALGMRAAG